MGLVESLNRQRVAYYTAVLRYMALRSAYDAARKLAAAAERHQHRSRVTRAKQHPHRPRVRPRIGVQNLGAAGRFGRRIIADARSQPTSSTGEQVLAEAEARAQAQVQAMQDEVDVQGFVAVCAEETAAALEARSDDIEDHSDHEVGPGHDLSADDDGATGDGVVLDDVDDVAALRMLSMSAFASNTLRQCSEISVASTVLMVMVPSLAASIM